MDTLIRIGSRGYQVIQLQEQLNNWGFPVGKVDGIFGPKTLAAVIRFQEYHNLKPDGIVGPETNKILLTPPNVQALINVIIDTGTSSDIRSSVIYALGDIKSKEAVQPLINIITTDRDSDVRSRAIDALGDIKSKEAVQPLINIITTDRDSDVRSSAIEVLGRIESKEAVQPLINIITTDRDSFFRFIAIEALGRIESKEAV
ncbi:HEAT repeat domain-containing protein, partial [Okeania sp. SIO2B9]|uniref:HEAT repeat domain-containing protein n=1 Tax=Okeania sp. SIO2B9 TaxID=2607782 RepID=UPI00142AE34E